MSVEWLRLERLTRWVDSDLRHVGRYGVRINQRSLGCSVTRPAVAAKGGYSKLRSAYQRSFRVSPARWCSSGRYGVFCCLAYPGSLVILRCPVAERVLDRRSRGSCGGGAADTAGTPRGWSDVPAVAAETRRSCLDAPMWPPSLSWGVEPTPSGHPELGGATNAARPPGTGRCRTA